MTPRHPSPWPCLVLWSRAADGFPTEELLFESALPFPESSLRAFLSSIWLAVTQGFLEPSMWRLRSGCRMDFIRIQIQVWVRTRHGLLDKVKVNIKARLEGEFLVTFLSTS